MNNETLKETTRPGLVSAGAIECCYRNPAVFRTKRKKSVWKTVLDGSSDSRWKAECTTVGCETHPLDSKFKASSCSFLLQGRLEVASIVECTRMFDSSRSRGHMVLENPPHSPTTNVLDSCNLQRNTSEFTNGHQATGTYDLIRSLCWILMSRSIRQSNSVF